MKRTASDTASSQDAKKARTAGEDRFKALIICGAPGSGKGTQCAKLVAEFGFAHLSTGDLLREAASAGTELGKQAQGFMDKGELVPDSIVIELVNSHIHRPEFKDKGWILDGFPRTKPQAEALQKSGVKPDKIVFLDVPDSILVERVTGRREDPTTGQIYHIKFNPPPDNTVAARLIQRSDDTEEKLKTRLTMYHNNNKNILDFYRQSIPIDQIDGNRKPEEVFVDIRKAVVKAAPAPAPKTRAPPVEYDDFDEDDDDEEEEQNSGDDYTGGDDEDDDDIDEESDDE